MAIEFIQFSAATATDGVLIAADIVDNIGTATGVSVQTIKFGYGTDGVYNEVATGQGIPVATGAIYHVEQSSTATSPVSVGTWTATGQVRVAPISVRADIPTGAFKVFNVSTATTVATFATSRGTNTFSDMTAIHVSNGATNALGVRIRDTSTSTVWNHEIAGGGGGFTLTFDPPLPQALVNNGWDITLDAASTSTIGIALMAAFVAVT